jgi:hypothetical protein
MSTEQQSEASRINGAKSQGPQTPEGLEASSRNSLKHGFSAKTLILQNESSERFLEAQRLSRPL